MEINIIRTEEQYEQACSRIYELMHLEDDALDRNPALGEELDLLAILVEKYEQDHYSLGPPDPIEAIKFHMEQNGLKQKDIAPLFGGKTRVSEVLNRKRPLSMKMIILLNRYLGIPMESLTHGNSEVYLSKEDMEVVMEHPAIRDYVRRNPVSGKYRDQKVKE
ncbi:MAG: helix-turn-helix domain-containing protein [Bacteroidetes bacterium]|nr:MAG: helix-turn-helix domain-containing protein [Bacteroidota bacterium]